MPVFDRYGGQLKKLINSWRTKQYSYKPNLIRGQKNVIEIQDIILLLQYSELWRALLNDCIQRSKLRCQTDRDSSFPYAFLVHWLLDLVIAFTLAFCARYILDSLDINVTNNFTRWMQ